MSEVIDTPTQASRTTAALELLALLTERYPEAFRHEGEPPQPLAIGTDARLVAELALEPDVVNTAMRLYTRRRAVSAGPRGPAGSRGDGGGRPWSARASPRPGARARPRHELVTQGDSHDRTSE